MPKNEIFNHFDYFLRDNELHNYMNMEKEEREYEKIPTIESYADSDINFPKIIEKNSQTSFNKELFQGKNSLNNINVNLDRNKKSRKSISKMIKSYNKLIVEFNHKSGQRSKFNPIQF